MGVKVSLLSCGWMPVTHALHRPSCARAYAFEVVRPHWHFVK